MDWVRIAKRPYESSARSALKKLALSKTSPFFSASPRLRVNLFLCASAALRESFFAGAKR
jgi:hypothetical protein